MQIKDVLERIKEVSLPVAAKELQVGRDRLQKFLSEIGCRHKRGTKEWLFEGQDAAILSEDIYNHVHKTPENGEETKKRRNEQKSKPGNEQKQVKTKKQDPQPTKEPKSSRRKRASFDIDSELLKELKIFAIRQEKNTYEVAEQAIREYLREHTK